MGSTLRFSFPMQTWWKYRREDSCRMTGSVKHLEQHLAHFESLTVVQPPRAVAKFGTGTKRAAQIRRCHSRNRCADGSRPRNGFSAPDFMLGQSIRSRRVADPI
jgi:hypothetical protein